MTPTGMERFESVERVMRIGPLSGRWSEFVRVADYDALLAFAKELEFAVQRLEAGMIRDAQEIFQLTAKTDQLPWISVETELPPNYEQVLVYLQPVAEGPKWYPRTNYSLAWSKRGIWFGAFINMETSLAEKGELPEDLVTHWRHLDAPPALLSKPTQD